MTKIQDNKISTIEELDNIFDVAQRLSRFRAKTRKKCAVCGTPLSRFLFSKRLQKRVLYCSWKCFVFKPPSVVLLEKQFGKDIKEILIETARKYDTLEKQEHALNKSSQWIYSSVRKYFNLSLPDFLSKYGCGYRKEKYLKKKKKGKELSE